MRRTLWFVFAAAALLLSLSSASSAQNWTLFWSDEFDGPAGSAPDQSRWGYDIGGGGWGNNELEYYTSRLQNVFLDGNGNLVIKAISETYTGSDGVTRNYTSGRLLTKNKFDLAYGRFEARLRVPFGQGIWPAFWMLGNNIDQVGWPACGEIDIMENIGREPSVVHGTLHGPGYSGASPLTGSFTLADGQKFSDDFHVFAMEWEPAAIRIYVDGNLYVTKTPADVPAGRTWVYDHPFFMILNVAVGGNWPGNPDSTTTFPQMMTVDYVRVYYDADARRRPVVAEVTVSGKKLMVTGENFDRAAVILVNGAAQSTKPDGENRLLAKKGAKKIKSGNTVQVQVRNPDGLYSEYFSYTRP
jgi:beta-glucanase (GH16 family)